MANERMGSYVEQSPKFLSQGLYEVSATKKYPLGTRWKLADGREFAYCKAGAVALEAGLLGTVITTPVHEDTVTVAHPAGTKVVTITAASVTANQFEDGYLIVTEGTGIGEMYKIRSNTATDANGLIRVTLYDGLVTAWNTSDTDVDLYPNPYNGIIVNPTDSQQKPVVVTPINVPANYYYWGLVNGFGALKMAVGAGVGLELDEKYVMGSTTQAGCGMVTGTPSDADQKHIIGEIIKEEDIANGTCTLVRFILG